MKAIDELLEAFIRFKYTYISGKECVEWARDRLFHNEEENDEDIILLARLTEPGRSAKKKELCSKILQRYIDKTFLEEEGEYYAGKFIVNLYESYTSGSVDIRRLSEIIEGLYIDFMSPDWLAILHRNSHEALNRDDFRKPFEDEFLYIYETWKNASSVLEFKRKYDRQVSNSHNSELLDILQEVIAEHPYYALVKVQFCRRLYLRFCPVNERLFRDPKDKDELLQQLGADASHVIHLEYRISTTERSGEGDMFVFLFHPQSYALLRTFDFKWRSDFALI